MARFPRLSYALHLHGVPLMHSERFVFMPVMKTERERKGAGSLFGPDT
jgi:hypothetical protein